MNVAVVIPAHNEAAALPACLDALSRQKTKHNFKVILVDNASTDETTKVAKSWQNRLDIQVIREPVKGRGCARHRGFAAAHTDIILSSDADSIVPSDWVESLVDALIKRPEIAAVTGSSYITDGTKLTNWTMKVGMPLSLRLYRLLIGHYMVTGANFAIRRKTYEAAGGFDADRDMLDDVDLSFRISRIGKIDYLSKLKVRTEGDIFGQGYLQGFWHYFRYFPPLVKRYGLRGRRVSSRSSRSS
jgi:glycosyltransferase involved in cell wall biosynthesis